MARINTSKMLSNTGYFSSVDFGEMGSPQKMTVSPIVEDQYDFAMTEDPTMLLDTKDTAEKLFEIWQSSPYYEKYNKVTTTGTTAPKIPKDMIQEVFYYMKTELTKQKELTTQQLVMGINEFFEFNYEYIVKKVLSDKMRAEIIEEYYNNGMKERIDVNVDSKLF